MSTNYYFISSPLHLLFSANLAIQNQGERNIAILISKAEKQIEFFSSVIQKEGSIFSDLLVLKQGEKGAKTRQRKENLKTLKDFVLKNTPHRVYTGTDRRVEFQFTMHKARKENPGVTGIYLDEGTATYVGHFHMNSIQHRWVDPLLKKIGYGFWWNNPVIIGESKWIDEVYAAFPEFVHPLLKGKKLHPIEQDNFHTTEFSRFAQTLAASFSVNFDRLSETRLLILLSLESFYDDPDEHLAKLIEHATQFVPLEQIAIKAHPRSKSVARFQQRYPEIYFVDSKIGLEMLLPHLTSKTAFVGDISSTLFTVKWFNPIATLATVEFSQGSYSKTIEKIKLFYRQIGVPSLTYSELNGLLE